MSARHQQFAPARAPADAPSKLDVFRLRCEARAELVIACLMDFHEAVDGVQAIAVREGLVAELGQDEVQAIVGAAFARVRDVGVT